MSGGVRSRLENALFRGSRGAASGALMWYWFYSMEDTPAHHDIEASIITGAVLGAVAGAAIGTIWPEERWRRVRLPR